MFAMSSFSFCVACSLACLLTACAGSGFNELQQARAEQKQPAAHRIDPRVEALVVRGSIAEVLEDYKTALDAYQEAKIYDPDSPGLFLAIAQVYQKMNRFDAALEVLKQGAMLDSTNIEILENLAFLQEIRRDQHEAIRLYERLVKLSEFDIEYLFRLGSLYLQSKQYDKAIAAYDQIVRLGFATPEVWRPLGLLYLEKGQIEEARQTFQAWIDEYPDDEQAYLDMAELYKAKNDTTGLLQWYEKALDANSHFDAIRADLRAAYVKLGMLDNAIRLNERSLAEDSTDAESLAQMALLYLQKGDTTQALGYLDRLRRSGDSRTAGQLGFLYLQAGDTLQAQHMFESLLETHPDDWRSYYNLGQLKYFSAKWPETIEYLLKAIEFNDEEPALWLMLGETYLRVDSLEHAEKAVRRAHELVPDSKDTNYMLGFVLYQLHRNQEAATYFENTLAIDSTDVRTMGILATIYDSMERFEQSDSLYERALQLAPDNSILSNNYSYSLAVRGVQLEKAERLVDRALKAEPENPAYLDTKGWVLFKRGRYQEALQYIEKSLEIRQNSAEVWEHLGDVHEKLGNYEQAVQSWRKALELDNSRKTLLEKLNAKGNAR